MKTLQTAIKSAREQLGLTLQEVSSITGIDTAVLSKIERGLRVASAKQFNLLANALNLPLPATKALWMSDRILQEIGYDQDAMEALQVAEEIVKYHIQSKKSSYDSFSGSLKTKLQVCDELLKEWQAKRPLEAIQLQKMEEFFRVNYTYESNRIEGNTLTMQETHLVVNEGITIGGKSMREHLEAINHYEAIDYLYDLINQKVPFSERV
jgi:transcriptional regulator with XRE-family HTH domain